MKFKLLSLLLVLLILTGCTVSLGEPRVPTSDQPDDTAKQVSSPAADPFAADPVAVPDPTPQTNLDPAPQTGTDPAPQTGDRLSKEQAQAIALLQAGLTADQVTRLRVEFEIDNGIPLYEVEFYSDGWEYDCEVHAETGAILSFDRDRD